MVLNQINSGCKNFILKLATGVEILEFGIINLSEIQKNFLRFFKRVKQNKVCYLGTKNPCLSDNFINI